MNFAMVRGGTGIALPFIAPVHEFLSAHEHEFGAKALAGTLLSTKAAAVSEDDKTLLWAWRPHALRKTRGSE